MINAEFEHNLIQLDLKQVEISDSLSKLERDYNNMLVELTNANHTSPKAAEPVVSTFYDKSGWRI